MTKSERLEELYAEYAAAFGGCETVFGSGDPDSAVVFVGEAPGAQEVRQNMAFVGPAGKNLSDFLAFACIARDKVYITNAIKYRLSRANPATGRVSNRPATPHDIAANRPWLVRELAIIAPRCVVTLGNVPYFTAAGEAHPGMIGALHGRPVEIGLPELHFTAFPLYHPASVIYNKKLKDVYEEDLIKLNDYLSHIGG
jgi:uracil-DNA glycosylase family 4